MGQLCHQPDQTSPNRPPGCNAGAHSIPEEMFELRFPIETASSLKDIIEDS